MVLELTTFPIYLHNAGWWWWWKSEESTETIARKEKNEPLKG